MSNTARAKETGPAQQKSTTDRKRSRGPDKSTNGGDRQRNGLSRRVLRQRPFYPTQRAPTDEWRQRRPHQRRGDKGRRCQRKRGRWRNGGPTARFPQRNFVEQGRDRHGPKAKSHSTDDRGTRTTHGEERREAPDRRALKRRCVADCPWVVGWAGSWGGVVGGVGGVVALALWLGWLGRGRGGPVFVARPGWRRRCAKTFCLTTRRAVLVMRPARRQQPKTQAVFLERPAGRYPLPLRLPSSPVPLPLALWWPVVGGAGGGRRGLLAGPLLHDAPCPPNVRRQGSRHELGLACCRGLRA